MRQVAELSGAYVEHLTHLKTARPPKYCSMWQKLKHWHMVGLANTLGPFVAARPLLNSHAWSKICRQGQSLLDWKGK